MLFRCQSKKQKRTIKQRISAVLISAELLSLLGFMTGCGGSKAAIPQLEEPIVAEASYRPLSKFHFDFLAEVQLQSAVEVTNKSSYVHIDGCNILVCYCRACVNLSRSCKEIPFHLLDWPRVECKVNQRAS